MSLVMIYHALQLMLGLGLAILVHEFGHFLAARWAGIRVERFSIGFPPRLIGFVRGGTEYVLSALPLGGYVKLAGEEWSEDRKPRKYELMAKPWWVRVIVYSAGVTMNLILAWIIFFGVYLGGQELGTYPAVLGDVKPGGTAAKAGLLVGDRIAAVNGKAVTNWEEMGEAADGAVKGSALALTVERDGRTLALALPATGDPGFGPRVEPVIGAVVPLHPAAKAGLLAGDRIVEIDGNEVVRWSDLPGLIGAGKGKPVRVRVRRGSKELSVAVTPRMDHASGRALIGIEPKAPLTIMRTFSVLKCAEGSARMIAMVAIEIPKSLWQVISGKAPFREVLGGPVLIAKLGIAKAEQGFSDLVHFVGILNVQLMVVNLLPIPVLDGGMILLAVLEAVRRRRFAYETYARLTNVGAALLIGLMLYATFFDLKR